MKKEQSRPTSKPKGQQSSSKTKTNKKPGRWEDPNYVQIKSNMLSFIATIDNIRQRHEKWNDILTLLSKTPFWPLIEAYMQKRLTKLECMKSNYDIVRLIKDYDTKTRKFKFNHGHSEMKSQDVAEIFGLPNRGNKLPCTTSSTRPDSHFVKKYFTGYKKITKTSIDKCLNLALEDETEEGPMDYWLCQRSNLLTPIPGREQMTPGAVKWSLQELSAKLHHLKNNQIKIKSTKVQEEDDVAEEVNEEHDDAEEVNEEHDDAAQEENEEEDDATEEVHEEHVDVAEEENEEEDDENQEHEVHQHHQLQDDLQTEIPEYKNSTLFEEVV
ncbi:AT-rich interactive domain-containing protein 4B-like [Prunus avium]|uniref:AT-rich interactive domain-containing protein 4B-like n=1 Tax=Prunus avium TaxID=42229 RepID=A0A6P5S6B7_PRUAV|nr:AT-rich interactive domain-containing protein 4B-like [Prunus avium]